MTDNLEYGSLIVGEFTSRRSQDKLALINPADERAIGSIACATQEDIAAALQATQQYQSTWATAPASERGAILLGAAAKLRERIEENALQLTREQGKPIAEARAEWERAIETFEWHGSQAERLNAATVLRTAVGERAISPEPIGVAAAFAPWNYPAVIIARKLGAALVAGCAVILKAAEETPSTAVAIAQALFAAGLPKQALQLLLGRPAEISTKLLASPTVRVMSFTGSTPVGKQLARLAADNLTRTVLELGGHSAVIVCADAEIESAVSAVAAYKYDCSGQSCNAPSRLFVAREVYDDFVEAFVEISRKLKLGNGEDRTTTMGPMANVKRMEAMRDFASDALALGGKLALGGIRLDRPGYFFRPTVVLDLPPQARLLAEEPFGPILPIIKINSIDEGVARANDNQFGLASYVFATDPQVANSVARRLVAGSVGINQMRGVPPDAAVAGVKDSGYGYEGGVPGVQAFQNLKLISQTARW